MSDTTPQKNTQALWIRTGIIVVVIAALAAGFIYWRLTSSSVYVDAASIDAPLIDLAPSQAGTLEEVYVNVGDEVPQNATVARVGNELIKSKVSGVIVSEPDTIGALISPGEAVVTMVDPTQLRVIGKVDENKGLSNIQVGESVTFTVDAFGSQKFTGVIDEISPTSNQSGIVFNISNQRQTQQFDVKARFDTSTYPQLKNGMSARMWIYPDQNAPYGN
jgi:multidrug resistance efflux pump